MDAPRTSEVWLHLVYVPTKVSKSGENLVPDLLPGLQYRLVLKVSVLHPCKLSLSPLDDQVPT